MSPAVRQPARDVADGLLAFSCIVMFAGLVLDGAKFPGVPFPANSLFAGGVVFLAMWRRPVSLDRVRWFAPAMVGLIAWLVLASILSVGVAALDLRRAVSLLLWALLAIAVGSGRIPQRLMAYGLATGVVAGVLWGIVTLSSSGYAGRLTGVFGDPNTAGLIVLTFTCLSLAVLPGTRVRWGLALFSLGGTYLTLSRTTFLATAAVILWVLVGRRVSRWVGGIAVVGLVWWTTTFGGEGLGADQFAGRAGSDLLRQRIMDASQAAVDSAPTLGNGLGSAHVEVDTLTFFFHSSYLSLRQEGGWPALVIFLGILVSLFMALASLPQDRRNVWIEASFIGVAICATNLGEVFLRIPTALTIGFAVWHLGVQRRGMRQVRTIGEAVAGVK